MSEKIKKILSYLGTFFLAVLGIVFFFIKRNDDVIHNGQVKDAKLEGKQEKVEEEIDKVKDELEDLDKNGVGDLPDDEIEDYWKDKV